MTTATAQDKDARIHELEGMLKEHPVGHEHYIMPFGLTQQQAKLLALLMEVPVASADIIQRRVKMSTEAKVAIHRLRARMKLYDVEIKAKRFYGFWLEPDQKIKVKELM
jgi:hypothetical protein